MRGLRVSLFHPKDRQLDALTARLEQLGCHVHAFWPPTIDPPDGTDLVMFAVSAGADGPALDWAACPSAPPVVALVCDESPAALRLLLKLGAKATLAMPADGRGLLPAIAVARATHDAQRRLHKLEQKLASLTVLNDAKSILVRTRNIDEEQAYTLIRERAMARRVSTDQIARAIVDANRVLGL